MGARPRPRRPPRAARDLRQIPRLAGAGAQPQPGRLLRVPGSQQASAVRNRRPLQLAPEGRGVGQRRGRCRPLPPSAATPAQGGPPALNTAEASACALTGSHGHWRRCCGCGCGIKRFGCSPAGP
jgi:hypothetical protein